MIDFSHDVYGSFPLMLALIALATFVLLARAFRSLLLPLKAVVMNLASLGAAYGVMVWIWQHGHASHLLWGIPATGAITMWVPIMVFAFLFGLSMDYEVFILARMRETYDATGDTRTAVVEGIGRTGRLVTSAALILVLSFLAMSTGPGDRHQDPRHRPGRRHPRRRHPDPLPARPRPGQPVRRLQLVAARLGRAATQSRAVPARHPPDNPGRDTNHGRTPTAYTPEREDPHELRPHTNGSELIPSHRRRRIVPLRPRDSGKSLGRADIHVCVATNAERARTRRLSFSRASAVARSSSSDRR